jgi:hypothetical protein
MIYKLYISLIVLNLLLWSLNFPDQNARELNARITYLEKNKYLLKVCFNMRKIKYLKYGPSTFSKYKKFVSDDTTLIKKFPNKSDFKLHNDYFIIENSNHQKKVLFIDYVIFNGKRSASMVGNFFDTPTIVTEAECPEFCVTKQIYSISDLKINEYDKKVKVLYL